MPSEAAGHQGYDLRFREWPGAGSNRQPSDFRQRGTCRLGALCDAACDISCNISLPLLMFGSLTCVDRRTGRGLCSGPGVRPHPWFPQYPAQIAAKGQMQVVP